MWLSLFAPPHDNPPSLAGEGDRGIQFPQHKHKHTSQARGDEARKAQGGSLRRRGKEPTPRVPREVDYRAGAFPHPFRGREESC
eukprot:scaffold6296_cov124-Isochrysis_galbana.AAC.2